MKSRLLIPALTLCMALSTSANVESSCEKPLFTLFGPFFSQAFIEKNFRSIFDRIEELTNCSTQYHASENYDLYHENIKSGAYDIIIIPSMQQPYILPWGYKHVVAGLGPLDMVLVGRRSASIETIEDLRGKRLLLNGDMSSLAVTWRAVAHPTLTDSDVIVIYSANTDQMLLRLLRGEVEATVTFRNFYDQLPKVLQNKLNILGYRTLETPGSIVVNERLSNEFQNLIRQAYDESSTWFDKPAVDDLKPDPYSKLKLEQVFNLKLKKN